MIQTVTPPKAEQTTPTPTQEPTPDPKPTPPDPKPTPPPPTQAQAPVAAETDVERGRREERERVTALQALDRPATHAIIEAAIKDGKTVADVTAACIDAMDKATKQSARREDASVLNRVRGSDSGALQDGDEDFGALLTKKVTDRMKIKFPKAHGRN